MSMLELPCVLLLVSVLGQLPHTPYSLLVEVLPSSVAKLPVRIPTLTFLSAMLLRTVGLVLLTRIPSRPFSIAFTPSITGLLLSLRSIASLKCCNVPFLIVMSLSTVAGGGWLWIPSREPLPPTVWPPKSIVTELALIGKHTS